MKTNRNYICIHEGLLLFLIFGMFLFGAWWSFMVFKDKCPEGYNCDKTNLSPKVELIDNDLGKCIKTYNIPEDKYYGYFDENGTEIPRCEE